MKQQTEPRYSDERQQQRLLTIARGKCSAASRRVGARLRYFPMIAGHFVDDPDNSEGFDTNHDAVTQAQDIREKARRELGEPNGSM